MKNYNIIASTGDEKYNILNIIRKAGATVEAVSGCGGGYYIQLTATDKQAKKINKLLGNA